MACGRFFVRSATGAIPMGALGKEPIGASGKNSRRPARVTQASTASEPRASRRRGGGDAVAGLSPSASCYGICDCVRFHGAAVTEFAIVYAKNVRNRKNRYAFRTQSQIPLQFPYAIANSVTPPQSRPPTGARRNEEYFDAVPQPQSEDIAPAIRIRAFQVLIRQKK